MLHYFIYTAQVVDSPVFRFLHVGVFVPSVQSIPNVLKLKLRLR